MKPTPEQSAALIDLREFRRVRRAIQHRLAHPDEPWQSCVVEFSNVQTDSIGTPQKETDRCNLHIIDPQREGLSKRFMVALFNFLDYEIEFTTAKLMEAGIDPAEYADPDEEDP